MIEKSKYNSLKVMLDIASAAAIFYLIAVLPIIGHYMPHGRDSHGNMILPMKLLILAAPFGVFGVPWLAFRYAVPFYKRHPSLYGRKYRYLLPLILPVFFLLVHTLLKLTIWR